MNGWKEYFFEFFIPSSWISSLSMPSSSMNSYSQSSMKLLSLMTILLSLSLSLKKTIYPVFIIVQLFQQLLISSSMWSRWMWSTVICTSRIEHSGQIDLNQTEKASKKIIKPYWIIHKTEIILVLFGFFGKTEIFTKD